MAPTDLHATPPGEAEPKKEGGNLAKPDKSSCLKEVNNLSAAENRTSVTAMRSNGGTLPNEKSAVEITSKETPKAAQETKDKEHKPERFISLFPGDKRVPSLLHLIDEILPLARQNTSLQELIKERTAVRDEILKQGKFGSATQQALTACTKYINENTTEAARALIDRGIPVLNSPIPVPIDYQTKAQIGNDRYRSMIASGKLSLKLPTTIDNAPNPNNIFKHVDQLQTASKWLFNYADPRLESAAINALVEGHRQKVSLIDTHSDKAARSNLADWLPNKQLSDKESKEWLIKVDPWLRVAEQAGAYSKAIDNLDRASKAGNQWCVSRWGSKSFSEVIDLKDFPGTVERDNNGNITGISLDLPNNLERTQENIAKIQRISDWANRVAEPVKQVINEFTLDRAKKDRLCMWADEPTDGLTENGERYNYISRRFNTEEVTVQVTGLDGKTHPEQRLKLTTSEQSMWVPDYSYHGIGAYTVGKAKVSGFASINGNNLEPGREYSIGPKGDIKFGEVSLPQNKIKVRVNNQGALQIYDFGNNDEGAVSIRQADGSTKERIATNKWINVQPGDKVEIGNKELSFENDIRLYKPDDWVTVVNNTGLQIMRAKDLGAWGSEAAVWHEGGKFGSIAMDVGMIVSGTIELKAAKFVGEKGLATATEKALATLAEKAAMRKNGWWHLALGASGFTSQLVENEGNNLGQQLGIGRLGTWANTARSAVMMFDIAATNFSPKSIKSWWGARIGEAHPESMKAFLDASTAARVFDIANKPFLAGAELEMLPDIIYNKMVLSTRDKFLNSDPLANANAESPMKSAEEVANHAVMPSVEKIAEDLIKISNQQTQKIIKETIGAVVRFQSAVQVSANLRTGMPEYDQALEPEAERLAKLYADSKTKPEQQIAAIIGLLRLKQRPDGSLPEVLATFKQKGEEAKSLSLQDAQRALLEFRPIHDSKAKTESAAQAFSDSTRAISSQVSNPDLYIKKTNEFLSLSNEEAHKPENIQLKKEHMDLLAIMYRFNDSDTDKMAAGLGLLMLSREANGAIPQQIGDTIGWETTMSQLYRATASAQLTNQLREPISDPIIASDVINFLRKQLGQSASPESKLAIADTLHRLKQMSDTELGGVCQEILNDKQLSSAQRVDAMLDTDQDRLAEILGRQRFDIEETVWNIGNTAKKMQIAEDSVGRNSSTMQQSLLSVLRDNNEDADVRALALSLLHIGNIADPNKRKAEIAVLKSQWLACSDSQTHFAQYVAANLRDKISFEEKLPAPSSPEAKAQRFQSALSLYELRGLSIAGAGAVEQKAALANLLSCLTIEKRATPNNIIESSYVATQALPILVDNFGSLSENQKNELRSKVIDLLASPPSLSVAQAKIEAKNVALEKLDHIFAGCDQNTLESLAKGLKQSVDQSVTYLQTLDKSASKDKSDIATQTLKQVEDIVHKLAQLNRGNNQKDTVSFFRELAKRQTNPVEIRAAAIEGLRTLRPSELPEICADIAASEKDPELIARIRSLDKLQFKPAPSGAEYKAAYQKAKDDLWSATHSVNLSSSEKYIASHLWHLVADDFSNARQSRRLAESIKPGELKAALQNIIERAKQDDGVEERNALTYIVSSNGRPFFDAHREEAAVLAAEGLYQVCKTSSLRTKLETAPLMELCMSSQPLMPREARRMLLNGITWLYPGEANGAISQERAATAISLGLEQELKNTPARPFHDGDYEEGKKLQLDMLFILSRYAGDAQIPLLVAMAGKESPAPVIERDAEGFPTIIHYPDESSMTIARDGEKVISLAYLVPSDTEKSETWTKEKDKDVYFSSKDPKKLNPGTDRYLIDRSGNFILEVAKSTDSKGTANSFDKMVLPLSELSENLADKDHPIEEVRMSARQLITALERKAGLQQPQPSDSADNLERYEEARLDLEGRYLRQFRHMNNWFKNSGTYNMLDGGSFAQDEHHDANSELGMWWLAGYSPDYEAAQKKYQLIAKDQFDLLTKTAWKNSSEGQEARIALAYIVLSDGRPLRGEEDRTKMVAAASAAISELCRNQSPGTKDMISIVSDGLIAAPSLSTESRRVLFETIKDLANEKMDRNKPTHESARRSIDEAKAARIVARALEVEYKTMPPEYLQNRVSRWENSAFKESEKLQLDLLTYLKTTNYKGNMAQLEALAERSPSISVKHKAKELLRHFNSVSNLDFVAQAQIKPAEKATAIGTILKDKNASEDKIVQTIISNCDTPFSENGNRINDPRAEMLLEAMRSSNERIRVAAARGFTYCSSRSYIETPEELLLTVYDISKNGKRSACKEEAASLLTPLTWKYKFDPNGDLWASKIKPRLDELLKHKYSSDIASANNDK